MTLATRLKERRKRLGLSQSALASAAGVSQPTVANWENGGHTPRPDALERLASALDTDPTWLLSGELPARLNPANQHLAKPIQHIPVFAWPRAGDELGRGQPMRYLTAALAGDDLFAVDAGDSGFPDGATLIFARGNRILPGRFLVRTGTGYALEDRASLDDVLARLVYSVVPH